ncbi:MAG: hypothetical protein J6B45_05230 [Clostridia bacterium]|nr:hypothetical protein [Clostridia bacterium]
MKASRITNALTNIDDELILASASSIPKKRSVSITRWSSIAASFLAIFAIVISISLFNRDTPTVPSQQISNIPGENSTQKNDSQSITQSGTSGSNTQNSTQDGNDTQNNQNNVSTIVFPRPYKDNVHLSEGEGEISEIIRWENKAIYDQYTLISINGNTYSSCSKYVDKGLIKSSMGMFEARGFDFYNNIYHTKDFEVFELTTIDKTYSVAVKIDGEYFTYTNTTAQKNKPKTLGELFERYNLKENISLKDVDTQQKGKTAQQYVLETDDYIWQLLNECKNAPLVEIDPIEFHRSYTKDATFTITSSAYGVYKDALSITENGFLWTNAFRYSHTYEIGTEKANQIIDYVEKVGIPCEEEQYYYYIVGEVTEIGDGYIVIDDSVMCKNQDDGVAFSVIINTKKLERSCSNLSVGQLVSVALPRKITEDDKNIVDFAHKIQRYFPNDDHPE